MSGGAGEATSGTGIGFWQRPGVQRAAFGLLAAAILFAKLGQAHLANYDDCFYAQRAKEMLHGGDWITPHWAGQPQVDNPPLFMWLVALSFAVLGVTNYAAILPSALSGVLCVVLVHRLARELRLDVFTAWSASFVLVTTQYFMKFAKHAMLDVLLTLLFLLALLAYLKALAGDRRHYLLLGLCTALGVLTKSVMGFFPLIVAVLHLAWTRRGRELAQPWFLAGVTVALAGGLWWYGCQYAVRPEALVAKYQWMFWERSFVIAAERVAWWNRFDYLVSLAKHYWPWAPFALAGAFLCLRRAFARTEGGAAVGGGAAVESGATVESGAAAAGTALPRDAARLLLVWFAVVVGVMSLANEKKLWYVMAAFPCLALFSAVAGATWIKDAAARRRVTTAGFALLGLTALAVNLTPIPTAKNRRPDLQAVALAARALVPAGQEVLNLDAGYYSVNPQFLFYSDRSITPPLGDPAAVRRGLDGGRFALLRRAGYAAVAGADSARYPVVVGSGDWALVKAAPPVPVILPAGDPFR